MLNLDGAAVELLARKKGKDSLLAFTAYTHPRWVTSAHHIKLCYYLELLEELAICVYCGKEIAALGVFAPPRHSKTELVSRRFPAWCFGRHPEWQMICAQATGLLASDTGADVREILKSPEFRRIFDNITLREDAQAAGRWITNAGGIYFAAGVDGTIVGRGANILNIDDPHSGRVDADSQRMRDLAGAWYFGDALPRLMPPERQLLTQTRWHQDDLAGRVIPHVKTWIPTADHQFFCAGDWHVVRFRAIENEGTDNEIALWPDRYPLKYLHKRRDTMIAAGCGRDWESQYQQNPIVEEGTYLKRVWFEERYDEIPTGSIIYLTADYAVADSKARKDPDRTEIFALAFAPDERIYIVNLVTLISAADVWITRLIDQIEHWYPQTVFGESGLIRRATEPALEKELQRRHVTAYFEWLPSIGDKLARGRSFQAWAASGKVIFPRVSTWHEKAIDELVAVGGGGRYDDKFDALSTFFLAIDDASAGVLRPEQIRDTKRDIWEECELPPDGDSWRTQ